MVFVILPLTHVIAKKVMEEKNAHLKNVQKTVINMEFVRMEYVCVPRSFQD
jgi:hypothetical protein